MRRALSAESHMSKARSRHPAILAALLPLVIIVVQPYLFLTHESEVVRLAQRLLSESIAR
jgi:hypothetical protein